MLSVIPLPPNFFAPLRLNIRDTDLAVHPTALVGRGRIIIIISLTHVAYSVFPFPRLFSTRHFDKKRPRPCSK